MNWDIIAAASSALGAIGVILTVVYLAFQIRQNTRSVEGATEQELMALEVEVYSLHAQHADIYTRGIKGLAPLTPAERFVFMNLVAALMSLLYTAFVQKQRSLITESVWLAYSIDNTDDLKDPGFLDMWNEIKHQYPAEFRETIDAHKVSSTNTLDTSS